MTDPESGRPARLLKPAPDAYYIIESGNPKVQGFDGAVMSFVDYLYELAK